MAKASTSSASFEPNALGASSDHALSALAAAGPRAEDLVQAWIQAGNAAAISVAAEQAAGQARKAARRGLNVLKARGIELPRVERVVSVGGKKEEETLEAWMVAPDTRGLSLFVIAARSPS